MEPEEDEEEIHPEEWDEEDEMLECGISVSNWDLLSGDVELDGKHDEVEVTTEEGDEGAEVVRVNFVPKFRSADEEALYAMHLLEK